MSINHLETLRHSASHIMAQAVLRLFPGTKYAIGPAIENGFYYDFDMPSSLTMEDLEKIEKEMKKIIKENLKLERFEAPKEEALALMKDQPYKTELINELPEGSIISFYKQGEFIDLCKGPHMDYTGRLKAYKLLKLAGAYWRGDEKNKMLQRIYGTAFQTKEELAAHLEMLEEAKKRDHNKLGRDLKYFTTSELVGQGLPLLMPKGAKTIQILQRFIEDEEEKRGYLLTKTPYMAKSDLYKVSGHWDHYKEGMFILGDEKNEKEEILALRPMTCPFQFIIYNNELHSYRDLPIRYNETSTLFRNEASGEMHGLTRIRQFTLAEGHIICTPEQLEQEFKDALDLVGFVMKKIGIEEDIWYRFSKWDPSNTKKYINNPEAWEHTQKIMKTILDHIGINYVEEDGEAAFYGPKLDVQFRNVHGKYDTLITIQIDFALAERFEMSYVDKDNTKKRPYIIHRSSIGCYERTLSMLIEKYAGALPTWIAPEQARILPISEAQHAFCEKAAERLRADGIRCELDLRNEKIGYKIREAQMEKVPYMLVAGAKEVEAEILAVRSRSEGDLGQMAYDEFIKKIKNEL